MKFSSDPELEALVGRVCLIFARVEQEAGHVVAAAHGNWGMAMSTDYLDYSSNSRLLHTWLKAVGEAYQEVEDDVTQLSTNLRALKVQRDEWAHSADVVDLFLMMKEQGRSSMSDSEVEPGRLLNGRKAAHVPAPFAAELSDFAARASDVGDAATSLASRLDALITDHGLRDVRDPRPRKSARE